MFVGPDCTGSDRHRTDTGRFFTLPDLSVRIADQLLNIPIVNPPTERLPDL
jgi:hypothetical protein